MEGAVEEAQTLGHNYIGTEHILLSLLEETEGAAAELLIGMGVDIDALQGEVLDRIDHPHPEGDGEPSRTEKAKGRQAPQLIKKYGRNLNDMAKEDRMDPVIGRDKEIQRALIVEPVAVNAHSPLRAVMAKLEPLHEAGFDDAVGGHERRFRPVAPGRDQMDQGLGFQKRQVAGNDQARPVGRGQHGHDPAGRRPHH